MAKEELAQVTHDLVYTTMTTTTEIARLFDEVNPDLLSVIGNAIWAKICEGDVFNEIIRVMIEADPKFFADMLQDVLNKRVEKYSH